MYFYFKTLENGKNMYLFYSKFMVTLQLCIWFCFKNVNVLKMVQISNKRMVTLVVTR